MGLDITIKLWQTRWHISIPDKQSPLKNVVYQWTNMHPCRSLRGHRRSMLGLGDPQLQLWQHRLFHWALLGDQGHPSRVLEPGGVRTTQHVNEVELYPNFWTRPFPLLDRRTVAPSTSPDWQAVSRRSITTAAATKRTLPIKSKKWFQSSPECFR